MYLGAEIMVTYRAYEQNATLDQDADLLRVRGSFAVRRHGEKVQIMTQW